MGEATSTDPRAQRNRAGRRGGHLLTRALSPPNKTGLPTLLHSQRPCPGRSHRTPNQPPAESRAEAGPAAPAIFHTGHEPDREHERPAAQGDPQPRPVPFRAGRPQGALPGGAEPGGAPAAQRRDPKLGVEAGAPGIHDLLRRTNPNPMTTATITYTDLRTLPAEMANMSGDGQVQ